MGSSSPSWALLIIAGAAAAYCSVTDFLTGSRSLRQSYDIVRMIDDAQALVIDAESGVRGYVITGDAVAAAVGCFVLTFRAVAQASKLSWRRLSCSGEGVVDRSEGTTRFTALALVARLAVPPGVDAEKARRLLDKAERACLITNSLAVQPTLTCEVESG